MVLGIGPAPIDAPTDPQTMLGAHHDREEEQEAVPGSTKDPVHIEICARSTTSHNLLP